VVLDEVTSTTLLKKEKVVVCFSSVPHEKKSTLTFTPPKEPAKKPTQDECH
jgi:hypothetical protein